MVASPTSAPTGHDEESAEGISRKRISSLSDLIFGLALSISALTLIGREQTSDQAFFSSLAVYAFSFLILMSVWRAYSRATSVLPIETGGMVQMNVVLLFCVSVEPFLFNELFVTQGELNNSVSSTFAADMAVLFFVLAFISHTLAKEEKQLVPKASLARYRRERTRTMLVGLLFTISILPYFGVTNIFSVAGTYINIREVLWFSALAVSYSVHLFGLRKRSI
jgi:uncharacterized membrane protein